jgi:protein TonB
MKNLFILVLVFTSIVACSQSKLSPSKIKKRNYQEVIGYANEDEKQNIDKFAMYPNGTEGLHKHINKHLFYPHDAYQNRIEGTVILRFFVETDGSISNIEVYKEVHPLLSNEAIRVLKKMKPWVPGQKDGKPVRVEYKLPFVFKLQKG